MKNIITYCFLFFPLGIYAQLIPVMGTYNKNLIEPHLYNIESRYHTAIRPVYFCDIADILSKDSIPNPIERGLRADWMSENGKNSFLQAIPVVDLMAGQQIKGTKNIYNLGGGVLINAGIDNTVGISVKISHNYLRPPEYSIITRDSLNILHSAGFLSGVKDYYNSQNSFVFAYKPYEFLLLEAGFGKNFYGDGYRSLLLSENSYNYPYLKGEATFLKIKYSYVLAQLKNVGSSHNPLWKDLQTKYAVFHYFDWRISKRLSIGFFESVIMNQNVNFDVNYLNPIVVFRPVAFYLGSEDNVLMGLNLKLSINNNNILYGQVIIDDLVVGLLMNDIKRNLNIDFDGHYGWFANKWGIQGGYKTFNLLGIKRLGGFAEINITRPYIYSHLRPEQNYSHFGQGLAHPLGANFREFICGANYFINNFSMEIKFMYAQIGMDTANTHYGQNIFQPTMDGVHAWGYHVESYNNVILQGNITTQITSHLHFEYIINHASYLAINAGILYRNIVPEYGSAFDDVYFYLGLRTSISRIDRMF